MKNSIAHSKNALLNCSYLWYKNSIGFVERDRNLCKLKNWIRDLTGKKICPNPWIPSEAATSVFRKRLVKEKKWTWAVSRQPRATGDIDVWVRRSDDNAKRVWRALVRFGAPLADLKLEDLKTSDLIFQIGVEPRRIDIVTSITGVKFDEAWPDRKEVEIEGLKIPVIGRSHLLKNKKAVGRPQDLADVAWLEAN